MANLPTRQNASAPAEPAEPPREPWFGTIAITAGLTVTPLLIAVALWMEAGPAARSPLATGAKAPMAAPAGNHLKAGPLEHTRLRLKPI